jgi:DNA processing protein
MHSDIYKIALSLIPNVGPVLARKLVAYTGSVEAVFTEKKSVLEKVPGIGAAKAGGIDANALLKKAEEELQNLEKSNIQFLFYLDREYPSRLKECEDAPVVFFYKGKNCFNAPKILSVVGTRRSTPYGEDMCERLINELASAFPELIVVSGFAYGIDICAHKAAISNNLATVAVFGHGVNKVYPQVHQKYVKSTMEKGALVSEFPSDKKPDPGNFVSRNRIIAGLADVTVVIESGEKGGSLLTADMANSYNREVMAFPGRSGDAFSKGCNNLIKNNAAALIESASDLTDYMKWDRATTPDAVQPQLFTSLSPVEEEIINNLKGFDSVSFDQLSRQLSMSVSSLSSHLLNLEFSGIVSALPGKSYRLK